MRGAFWVAAGCATGCGGTIDPQTGLVLNGFSFGWDTFNHRLSHLELRPATDSIGVAVIGGTSTTAEIRELDGACDPDSCDEFPFHDDSTFDASWSVVTSDRVALSAFTAYLDVGDPGSGVVARAALPLGAKGVATAVLTGLELSTDRPPATGPACYDPRLGWHPRRIAVSLGEPTIDGQEVSLQVEATFAAGNTGDAARACIDEVNEAAVVGLVVHGLVVVGKDLEVEDHDFASSATFPFSGDVIHPEEQIPPAPEVFEPSSTPLVAGAASVDFSFYPAATDGKGAYLRTLGWGVSNDGTLAASATNWSPGTQLEDFAYDARLTARYLSFDGEVSERSASGPLRTELDDALDPIVHQIPAESP